MSSERALPPPSTPEQARLKSCLRSYQPLRPDGLESEPDKHVLTPTPMPYRGIYDPDIESNGETRRTPSSRSPETRPIRFRNLWSEILFVYSICMPSMLVEYHLLGFRTILSSVLVDMGNPGRGDAMWACTALSFSIGITTLLCGRMVEKFGYHLCYLFGGVWFALWSLAAGFAQYVWFLAICRGMIGVGLTGMLIPSAVLINATYGRSDTRATVVKMIYKVSPVVSVLFGLMMANVFSNNGTTEWYSWTGALLGLSTIITFIASTSNDWKERRLQQQRLEWDLTGAGAFVLGLFAVLFVLAQAPYAIHGWSTSYVLFFLIVGLTLLGIAIHVEGWYAQDPVLPSELFKPFQIKVLLIIWIIASAQLGIFTVYMTSHLESLVKLSATLGQTMQLALWYLPFCTVGAGVVFVFALVRDPVIRLCKTRSKQGCPQPDFVFAAPIRSSQAAEQSENAQSVQTSIFVSSTESSTSSIERLPSSPPYANLLPIGSRQSLLASAIILIVLLGAQAIGWTAPSILTIFMPPSISDPLNSVPYIITGFSAMGWYGTQEVIAALTYPPSVFTSFSSSGSSSSIRSETSGARTASLSARELFSFTSQILSSEHHRHIYIAVFQAAKFLGITAGIAGAENVFQFLSPTTTSLVVTGSTTGTTTTHDLSLSGQLKNVIGTTAVSNHQKGDFGSIGNLQIVDYGSPGHDHQGLDATSSTTRMLTRLLAARATATTDVSESIRLRRGLRAVFWFQLGLACTAIAVLLLALSWVIVMYSHDTKTTDGSNTIKPPTTLEGAEKDGSLVPSYGPVDKAIHDGEAKHIRTCNSNAGSRIGGERVNDDHHQNSGLAYDKNRKGFDRFMTCHENVPISNPTGVDHKNMQSTKPKSSEASRSNSPVSSSDGISLECTRSMLNMMRVDQVLRQQHEAITLQDANAYADARKPPRAHLRDRIRQKKKRYDARRASTASQVRLVPNTSVSTFEDDDGVENWSSIPIDDAASDERSKHNSYVDQVLDQDTISKVWNKYCTLRDTTSQNTTTNDTTITNTSIRTNTNADASRDEDRNWNWTPLTQKPGTSVPQLPPLVIKNPFRSTANATVPSFRVIQVTKQQSQAPAESEYHTQHLSQSRPRYSYELEHGSDQRNDRGRIELPEMSLAARAETHEYPGVTALHDGTQNNRNSGGSKHGRARSDRNVKVINPTNFSNNGKVTTTNPIMSGAIRPTFETTAVGPDVVAVRPTPQPARYHRARSQSHSYDSSFNTAANFSNSTAPIQPIHGDSLKSGVAVGTSTSALALPPVPAPPASTTSLIKPEPVPFSYHDSANPPCDTSQYGRQIFYTHPDPDHSVYVSHLTARVPFLPTLSAALPIKQFPTQPTQHSSEQPRSQTTYSVQFAGSSRPVHARKMSQATAPPPSAPTIRVINHTPRSRPVSRVVPHTAVRRVYTVSSGRKSEVASLHGD